VADAGELVETDQRVIVMAENDTTGVSWYHPAFEVCQETPYGFRDTTQFSNQPNRGGTGGSLLLMNHWIETVPAPKPSNAAIVNSRRFLMQRIQSFQRQRGRVPNIVAVDFYNVGDLIDVARELNASATPNRRPRDAARRRGRSCGQSLNAAAVTARPHARSLTQDDPNNAVQATAGGIMLCRRPRPGRPCFHLQRSACHERPLLPPSLPRARRHRPSRVLRGARVGHLANGQPQGVPRRADARALLGRFRRHGR
jgi:hypothetical protein